MSTARIAVAVKTLCSRGFVETSPAPTDGRKVVVKITQAGLAETKRNAAELEEFFKKLIKEVGESDLKEFFRIFTRINVALGKV